MGWLVGRLGWMDGRMLLLLVVLVLVLRTRMSQIIFIPHPSKTNESNHIQPNQNQTKTTSYPSAAAAHVALRTLRRFLEKRGGEVEKVISSY